MWKDAVFLRGLRPELSYSLLLWSRLQTLHGCQSQWKVSAETIHLVPVLYLRKSVNNLAISSHSEVSNSSLKEDSLRHYLWRPLTRLTSAIQCAKVKYSNKYTNIRRPKLQSQIQCLRQFKRKSLGEQR